MSKPPATLIPADPAPAEILAPSWARARQLLDGIRDAIRLSLAGQVMLGFELQQLKKESGHTHGGNKGAPCGHFVHTDKTWSALIQENLGISYKTADRMILSWDAARLRIRKLGGHDGMLSLMDSAPGSLGAEDRSRLASIVDKVTDGATQRELMEELKIVKLHIPLTGGDTGPREEKTPPSAEQMAFLFFSPVAESMHRARSLPDYQAFLHALPDTAEDDKALSLDLLEREHRLALEDIRAARKAKHSA